MFRLQLLDESYRYLFRLTFWTRSDDYNPYYVFLAISKVQNILALGIKRKFSGQVSGYDIPEKYPGSIPTFGRKTDASLASGILLFNRYVMIIFRFLNNCQELKPEP